ncbi:uncharacterized protein [Montipora foliosa]|uniref:uncharacterized protein n=1 Tax=Montipora foliosa TaxID=591990 RepID=UPI0035F1E6BB
MKVLLKKAAFRTFCMFLWGVCSAWFFVFLEYTEKGGAKEKYNLLISLYKSVATKYNMSVEEFNDFSRVAHEALTEPKLKWTFYTALGFVFQTFTTIVCPIRKALEMEYTLEYTNNVIVYVPLKVKSPHFPPLPMNASSGSQFEPFNPEDPSPRFLDWLVSSTAIFGLCLVSAVLNAIAAAIEEHKWRPRCPRCIPQKIQNKTHDKRDNPAERCDSRRASLKMDGFKDNNITSLSQF